MTIAGWTLFAILTALVLGVAIPSMFMADSTPVRILISVFAVVLIIGMLFGFRWYFNNTASGQRAIIDQKSNLGQGMDRTVTVYTANGDVIARYTGKIDVAANDGGYVKFDFDGKRYIYYNCFVETIAEID